MFDVSGHTAVITGAATGIGEAIARRLADAGAVVVIADLDFEAASATSRSIPSSFAVELDVTSQDSVDRAFRQISERRPRIEILVNNAGIAGKAAPLWEQTLQDWERIIAVNMTGVFHCCRAVIQQMRANRYGRIVNVASIAGKEGNPNMTGYSATKAAVIGFTKSLGKEVALDGICVNAITPAVVHTKLLDQLTPQQVDYMTQRIPMRRTGRPEEIAAVAHFLASPDCSFVTGQCYDASGGRAVY